MYALTRRIWNRYTSTEESVQYQGINQAFRVPGSKAKEGAGTPVVEAYRLSGERIGIEELNGYVEEGSRVDASQRYRPTKLPLEEAKERYPEWYERVIVGGQRGQWVVKRDLYDWWLRKISAGATYGHRYFCVMTLAIYAAKCGMYDVEKVRRDALALIPHFNTLNPEKPFTEADVESALDCLDSRYVRFPRSEVEKLSQIPVPPNKRNGRTRTAHMKRVNATIDFDISMGEKDPRYRGGAPTKRDLIRAYAVEHPEQNHSQIAEALGVSRPTVIKWLKPGWREEWDAEHAPRITGHVLTVRYGR